MLIRVSGYNSGVKEYLEEGVKNGRDYSRDELDERVILYGDLDVTDKVYKSIPDRGQNRYTTFTLSFREDEVSTETLQAITNEFREFVMYAYEQEEYNFYAEAHLPKIKELYDKRTGEKIERKPHIHIVVPKINLLSGNVSDVIGDHNSTERYLEAFQEYINQKYKLASPREHVRVNPYNSADVLSRYKGDDFRGKNREFKEGLVREIIDSDIRSRSDFYHAVSKYGETRIRNQGKDNEYIAVKIPGDDKFTNLKETIFNDSFLIDRKLKKPPLAKHVISERLHEWPMRSKEIKYIAKASKSLRNSYYQHSDITEKVKALADQQFKFYEKFGGQNELHPTERAGDYQRSTAETGRGWDAGPANRLQSLPGGDVAADRQTRIATGAVFLPGNARVYLEQPAAGGDSGLRSDLHDRGTGGTEAHREGGEASREGRTGTPEGTGETGEAAASSREGRTASTARREGGSEEAGEERKRRASGGAESTGSRAEGGESADQSREKAGEYNSGIGTSIQLVGTTGAFPDDPGSREAFRFTGVPELGRANSSFSVRGGLPGSGNRQLGIPVYARSARTVAEIASIEINSQRLFGERVTQPATRQTQAKIIQRVMPRAPKSASYVAACLQRRQQQNTLSGPQRSALFQADQKYYQTRRAIISDKRLSTKDKTQLLGVLMFERLKAHQLINQPHRHNQQENDAMSSADIRSTIKPQPKYRNTISGSEEGEKGPQDAKQRFRNMAKQVEENLGERSLREKVRIITAADLYTRKAKLSDNIHYLDKSSDKTLFIDTGKSIAVSKNGLTESGVAVALELAKEKFGSTLNVKGTESFKNTAIEVVAQKGLDIHFTDKEMNRRLAERKQELALEREGQTISSAESARPETLAEFKKAFGELEKDFTQLLNKSGALNGETFQNELETLSKESSGLRNYWMSSDEYNPDAALDKPSTDLEQTLRDNLSQKIESEEISKGVAQHHVDWMQDLQKAYPATTQEFEAALTEIENLYVMLEENAKHLTPDDLRVYVSTGQEKRIQLAGTYYAPEFKTRLEGLERKLSATIAEKEKQRVSSVNTQLQPASSQQRPASSQQRPQGNKTTVHEGVLIEHGSAPYNFKPDMTKPEGERDDSYYVKLQGPRGKEKIVWGVNLETAVEGLHIGERISLTNHGKEKVEWEQQLANGQTERRSGERVAWEGKALDRDVEVDEVEQYQTYEQYQMQESDGPSVA